MDELTLSGKTYVSSKRAAEITGYAKDYIGQLCREGHVEARMVGRSWYVLESSIKEHRFGKNDSEAIVRKDEQEETENETDKGNLPATWETPRYSAEPVPSIPAVRPVGMNYAGNMDFITCNGQLGQTSEKVKENIDISDKDQTISEMQEAWKEWFSARTEPLLESPEVVEAREEAMESLKREEKGVTSGSLDPIR